MSCIHVMVFRVTRDWDSALQEAPTTLTLVKTPASSSQKSSLEEQLPRTAGSGESAFVCHSFSSMSKNQVALPQGCIYNAATGTPDPAADTHQEDRVAQVSVLVKDNIKQRGE